MSGDLPIRKARTKREKNKSYNDSRMRFRASMKANANDNAPSEEDDKIEEKKMKVGEAEEREIEQPILDDNMSDDGAKEPVITKDENEDEGKGDSDKSKDDDDDEDVAAHPKEEDAMVSEAKSINSEVDNAETSGDINDDENKDQSTGDNTGNNILKDDNNSGGEGSGTKAAEGPSEAQTLAEASDALWDEMFFESDEDGKPIHQKGAKKYFKGGIPTPPAKTTSEEDTDDEEKGDETDDTDSQNDIDDKEDDKDMDDEGHGGGNASSESTKDDEWSGEDSDRNPYDKDSMGPYSDETDDGTQNKDNTDKNDVDDDGSKDAISEDFNIEGAVDPYDIDYDDEQGYSSSNDYDPYEFLSQDGGSGLEDNSYYSGEEEHDYIEDVVDVRGAG